jgi:neutral ceramidase
MIRVGTGRDDLSFPDGLGLFGFGPGGGRGFAVPAGSDDADTLQARALYIERGPERLLVVSFDLGSGSRVVHRALLDALARDGVQLAPGQLMVVGTHTHSAPGHYHETLYGVLGQWPLFYRADVVAELVRKGLSAARQALRDSTPCRVGVAHEVLWGAARNRSLRPFLENFGGDPTPWSDELKDELGVSAPPGATPEERAVDPRLTVVAFVGANDEPLATWATWCCHPATFRRAAQRRYHRDWPGVAVDAVEKRGVAPFAMVHMGANGDATPLPSGAPRQADEIGRVRELGEKVAAAWQRGFDAAASRAADAPFEVRFRSFVPRDEGLPPFEIGSSVLIGSEEFDPSVVVKVWSEATTFPWRSDPQRPKLPALGPLQYLLRRLPPLQPAAEHPLWLLRLGSHLFFASPFEQTTYAARTTEKALRAAWERAYGEKITASPVGLAGDFAGYLTTPNEFEHQNYEGAHTLYGRDQLAVLGRAWERMALEERTYADAPATREAALEARVNEALSQLRSNPQ